MIIDYLKKIKIKKPLIHCITNNVTIGDISQIIKNIGAYPVMAFSSKESKEITEKADALLINAGTLTLDRVKAMLSSIKAANKKNIPVVLDIVGFGISGFRKNSIKKIIEANKITLIKGNKAEISQMLGKHGILKGAESISFEKDIISAAKDFATKNNLIIAITGEDDVITDGNKISIIKNGVSLMSLVIGTGCMLGAVISSFCAIDKDYFNAALYALSFYGIIGEITSKQLKNNSPLNFKIKFIDNFFNADQIKKISKMTKINFI